MKLELQPKQSVASVKIYGLVDPRDGSIRYVGRTRQRLYMRRQQHIGEARKPKKVHSRARWIRDLLANRLKPLITHLQTVAAEEQISCEKFWIDCFTNLVNDGAAAQGGNRSYVVRWTEALDEKLGKVADSVIAEEIGVTRKTVSYRRKVLGIPASYNRDRNTPPPPMGGHNKIILKEWITELLGRMPDQKLADKANVSKRTINRERRRRKIPSFALKTGNTGRFQKGSFPMRWLDKKENHESRITT